MPAPPSMACTSTACEACIYALRALPAAHASVRLSRSARRRRAENRHESPKRQFPRHAKTGTAQTHQRGAPSKTAPTTQSGRRGLSSVEAFRLRRRLAGHQRTPKSLLADGTRVAPVEVRLAIVRHAAVVGVFQTRLGDVDAFAFDINVAARRAAATTIILVFVARRADNNIEAPRLSWRLAEHLRARVETTVLNGARVAAVVVRLAI